MGLLEDAANELTPDRDTSQVEVAEDVGEKARLEGRDATVMADGNEVSVEQPTTVQTDDDSGTWLSGTNEYGRPRGTQALENRQIVQTSAMQAIVNGVADQILGGELAFETKDDLDAPESRVEDLRDLIESILKGPHLQDTSLDDLITAAVEDMMGPGQAYWQILPSENGQLPVASLIELDPLTIRHNINRHGVPQDPPYWQAQSAFSGGGIAQLGSVDPTPLDKSQLAVMSYPKGHRSYQTYPVSPAWQVREWLEILANSTTHHNRFYSDNEIPPGLIQVVGASNSTVSDIKEKIQDASGDPRDVPIVGGEGGAQWLDMGGTSVNLNVIEEQRWFFFLCLGSLGLGKQSLGFVEDVNRSNGEVESSRVYKRVAGPFIGAFESAFKHICQQFDAYQTLNEPFQPTISFSDPREERAKEERLRKQLNDGAITPIQYARRSPDQQVADDERDWTIEINGEEINYGEHPTWVSKRLIANASDGVSVDDEPPESDEESGNADN